MKWASARAAVDQVKQLDLTQGRQPRFLLRLASGVVLPFAILRAVYRDPVLRPRYQRSVVIQLALVGLLGCLFAVGSLSGIDEAMKLGGEVTQTKRGVVVEVGDRPPREAAHDAEDNDDEDEHGPRQKDQSAALVLGTLWGVLKIADWIVAALFREPNDALTHLISRHLGAAEEEAVLNPRIRFSMRWAWRRLKRQLSAALAMGVGSPVLLLAMAVPLIGGWLKTVLAASWGFYWVAVLTVAKTAVAWQPTPPSGPTPLEPWFMRAWQRVSQWPLFAWWLPRWYGRMLGRVAENLRPPELVFERAPVEFLGLAMVRVLSSVPLLSTFLKGLLPLAAGYLATGQGFSAAPVAQTEK
jgi:hypothetical protein